ncbi:MAG: hypothetical protein ACM3SQ_01395 [Betaproteobacteria bacterium]
MTLVAKRVLAFAVLMLAYVIHPVLGIAVLLGGFGYLYMRHQRGATSQPE